MIGTGWEVPISNITVRRPAPRTSPGARPASPGGDLTSSCESSDKSGTSATFKQASVDPGEPLQVVTGFPAGTLRRAP